jgi:hypothetical protein
MAVTKAAAAGPGRRGMAILPTSPEDFRRRPGHSQTTHAPVPAEGRARSGCDVDGMPQDPSARS